MAKKRTNLAAIRRPLGMILLAVAVLLIVLAYHTVSTDQYRLYSKNYDYYLTKAEECRAMVGTELSAHYTYLAEEWEATAQMAKGYLDEHQAGALSLGVVALVAVGGGVKLLLPPGKKKKKEQHA